jgi:hypothetical protein
MGSLSENTMSVIDTATSLADRIERELDRATDELHTGLARYCRALRLALAVPGLLRTDEERAEFEALLAGIEAFQARVVSYAGGES